MHAWLPVCPWSRSCGMGRFRVTPLAPAAGTCLISALHAETWGAGSDGGREEHPFPVDAAGRTRRALPETSWGYGRAGSCSGPASLMLHRWDRRAVRPPRSRRAARQTSTRIPAAPWGSSPLRPSPWRRVTQAKSSKLPGGGFAGKQKALLALPSHKWQGMPTSPLSDTLSAPNPDMRRQLGAGIPFRRQQMGRGDAPWGWGSSGRGAAARSGSAS